MRPRDGGFLVQVLIFIILAEFYVKMIVTAEELSLYLNVKL